MTLDAGTFGGLFGSRLRYKDVEVQTWRIVASVVVVLAMLAFVGLLLMHELHARGH